MNRHTDLKYADNRFHVTLEDGSIRCRLCHHICRIAPGQTGICRVRRNDGGRLILPFFGRISGLADDPIEKKPLFHFFPGERVFSLGLWSCNLKCPFCQNHTISQSLPPGPGRGMTSTASLLDETQASGCRMIAVTYSEPLIHFEYLLHLFTRARERGLYTVLVTNGLINPEAFTELLALTDGINIDLKCFDANIYRNQLGGNLDLVCRNIESAQRLSFPEVTTLVVPGISDGEKQITAARDFLSGISPDLPWHLTAYYPRYRYSEPATPPDMLLQYKALAEKKLNYVYTGNIGIENDTLCPACGRPVIHRTPYKTEVLVSDVTRCERCGHNLNIFYR